MSQSTRQFKKISFSLSGEKNAVAVGYEKSNMGVDSYPWPDSDQLAAIMLPSSVGHLHPHSNQNETRKDEEHVWKHPKFERLNNLTMTREERTPLIDLPMIRGK